MGGGKGGGGSSKKARQRVTDYYMTVHYAICQGPINALRRIRVREKTMWAGRLTAAGAFSIDLPRLHGGPTKEGGALGTVDLQLGSATQSMSAAAAARYGADVTPTTAPGYRRISTIQFRGPNGDYQGFYWSSNQPVVPPVDIAVTRIPWGPGTARSTITAANPEPPLEGYDGNEHANPAYIIYECLVDGVWGMGAAAAAIDEDSFTSAAATLESERFGLSLMWTDQSTIEDFVQVILDHIEAVLYVSPFDGKFHLRLLRNDLVAGNLPLLTEDDMRVTNVVRQSPGETANEIVVVWTNPITEENQTVTIQDLAGIVHADGQIISASRNFFGIRDETLAWTVARRELASESTPLLSAEVEVDRRAWNYVPGDGVRLSSARYGLDGNVFRILKVNYGKPGQSTIQLNLIEDVFSRVYPVYSEAADGPTQRPMSVDPVTGRDPFDARTTPTNFDGVMFQTLPWTATSSDLQGNPDPDAVEVGVYPDTTIEDATEYELFGETITGGGTGRLERLGDRNVVRKGTTASALVRESVTTKPAGFFENLTFQGSGPTAQQIVILGSPTTPEDERELVFIQSGSATTTLELWRGVLDTIPRAWPTGTEARLLSDDAAYDDPDFRDVGVETDYKLLMITAAGQRSIDDAPTRSFTPSRRPHLPTRPANVSLEGTTYLSGTAVSGSGHRGLEFSWNNRNRLTEETRLLRWSDAAISPETNQEVAAEVYSNAALTGTPRIVRQTRGGRLALGKVDFPAASSWARLVSVFAPGGNLDEDSHSLMGAVFPVTNTTAMTDPLSPTSIVISARTVTLTYGDTLDSASVPDPGDFAVIVASFTEETVMNDDGTETVVRTTHSTVVTVTGVSVSGSTCRLSIGSYPGTPTAATVTYTIGDDPLQEANGVDVAGVSRGAASTQAGFSPTSYRVSQDESSIEIRYAVALNPTSIPSVTDFQVLIGTTVADIRRISISGTTVTLSGLVPAASAEHDVRVSYTSGTNPIQDTSGSAVANIVNALVREGVAPPLIDVTGAISGRTPFQSANFTLDSTSIVEFRLDGMTDDSNNDGAIEWFNADSGTQVGFARFENGTAETAILSLAAGSYYARVLGRTDSVDTPFRLRISTPQAQDLTAGSPITVTGSLDGRTDETIVYVRLATAAVVEFKIEDVTASSDNNGAIEWFNSVSGSQVGFVLFEDGAAASESDSLAAGVYNVRVASSGPETDTSFRLRVSIADPADLAVGSPIVVTGDLDGRTRQTTLFFRLAVALNVEFRIDGMTANGDNDGAIDWFESGADTDRRAGTLVFKDGADTSASHALTAGDYFVKVRSDSDSADTQFTFTLTAS